MPTIDESTQRARRLAQEATDQLTALVSSDPPPYEQFVDAGVALLERDADDHVRSQGLAAHFLVQAAREIVHPLDVDDTGPDPHDGYELLAGRRFEEVKAFADRLLATSVGTGDRDADLEHHAHILRGKVHAACGDADLAAAELLAAGDVDASPVLSSFGPDLSLAWHLLTVGQDAAVIGYLHRIARFWSPHDPVSDHSDVDPVEQP